MLHPHSASLPAHTPQLLSPVGDSALRVCPDVLAHSSFISLLEVHETLTQSGVKRRISCCPDSGENVTTAFQKQLLCPLLSSTVVQSEALLTKLSKARTAGTWPGTSCGTCEFAGPGGKYPTVSPPGPPASQPSLFIVMKAKKVSQHSCSAKVACFWGTCKREKRYVIDGASEYQRECQ